MNSTIIEHRDQFLDLIQNNDFNQLLLKMNSNFSDFIFIVDRLQVHFWSVFGARDGFLDFEKTNYGFCKI